jgi:hypothetical protein
MSDDLLERDRQVCDRELCGFLPSRISSSTMPIGCSPAWQEATTGRERVKGEPSVGLLPLYLGCTTNRCRICGRSLKASLPPSLPASRNAESPSRPPPRAAYPRSSRPLSSSSRPTASMPSSRCVWRIRLPWRPSTPCAERRCRSSCWTPPWTRRTASMFRPTG